MAWYAALACFRPPIDPVPPAHAMPHATCKPRRDMSAAAPLHRKSASRGERPFVRSHPPSCALTVPPPQGHSKIEKRDVTGFREIFVRAFECEDCGRR